MNLVKKVKSIQGNKIETFRTSVWKDYYTPSLNADGCEIIYDKVIPRDKPNIELILPTSNNLVIGRIFYLLFTATDEIVSQSDHGQIPNAWLHVHQLQDGLPKNTTSIGDPLSGAPANQPRFYVFMWCGKKIGWTLIKQDFLVTTLSSSWIEGNGVGEGGIGLPLLD